MTNGKDVSIFAAVESGEKTCTVISSPANSPVNFTKVTLTLSLRALRHVMFEDLPFGITIPCVQEKFRYHTEDLDVSQELIKKSKLYILTTTDLREENGVWFFKKLSHEYHKLPPEKRHWSPILYDGKK